MKLTQGLTTIVITSITCILTGTISKQPLLRGLGEIAALAAISRKIIVKQHVYLHEFDKSVSLTDLKLVRYADDFLVLSHTQERILQAQLEIIDLLDSMGLTINTEKSQITNFERGFRFLGHGFLENAIFPVDANKVKLKSAIQSKQEKKSRKNSSKKKVQKNLSYLMK